MLVKIDTENTENIVLCLKKNAVQTFINQRSRNDKNGYYVDIADSYIVNLIT